MFFLVLSNADVKFDARKLTWRKYTIAEVMPIARQVKLINKHKFVEVSLNGVSETFVVYMAVLKASMLIMIIDLIRETFLAVLK